jgi:hypothetical protein
LRANDLPALRDKYEQLLELRRHHERARLEGLDEPDPRRAMATLARAFPGALRELDDLPTRVLASRVAELQGAERDPSRLAPWMRAQASFHRLARGALALKRWLSGRALTEDVRAALTRELPTLDAAEDAAPWVRDLEAVAAPPRGRLMDLVYDRLAAELGISVREARALVHPPSSSRGRGA